MSGLRSRVVEAGARAMYEADDAYDLPWEDQGERNGVRDWYRRMFVVALDAFLGCLTENADETIHPRYNNELNPWRLFDASVEDLLAVLRNPE